LFADKSDVAHPSDALMQRAKSRVKISRSSKREQVDGSLWAPELNLTTKIGTVAMNEPDM
jgi:hypothetical protein